MFITDFDYPKLQNSAFNCLIKLEQDGIKLLVDLAIKDQSDLQKYILQKMINIPHIIVFTYINYHHH